jgi:putative colanic acid biosynthesis UDP-glucose lipid carrier transferase
MSVSENESSLFQGALDAALIFAALVAACRYHGQDWGYAWSFIAVCGIAAHYALAQATHLYRSWRIVSLRREITHASLVWSLAGVAVFVIALFNEPFYQTPKVLAMWFLLSLAVVAGWRVSKYVLLSEVHRHGLSVRRVAIVGCNPLGDKLATTLEQAAWKGFKFVGFYEDRRNGRTAPYPPYRICGSIDDLLEQAREGRIDLIYIALPMRAETRIREMIDKLSDSTTSVYVVPGHLPFDMLHPQLTTMGELPVIGIYETPFYGIGGAIKRAEDLVLGGILFAVALLPMLLIAAGIKLTSPGPVLFKQRRGGVNGEVIWVWKFRTMRVVEDGDSIEQAHRDDPRVTSFGKFLRKTSLDELPQLINVLQGTMSIVGPRPHAVTHNAQYRPLIQRYMLRHKVKPGLTGWAQINGWRGETEVLTKMEKRVEFDLQYINNWSLLFDLKIVALTPLSLLRNKDIY